MYKKLNIQKISKDDRNVVVCLSADDLVVLTNNLHETVKGDSKQKIKRLYADLMMARDLCQYGHINDFCFEKLIEQRKINPK